MATLIFRLNGVPDDEAEEVRQLLADHDLPFYETHAGRWGLSVAGIWLRQDEQADTARQLLETYAEQRQQQVREELMRAIERGEVPSFWQRVQAAPLRYVAIAALAGAILYLSIWPFIKLGG